MYLYCCLAKEKDKALVITGIQRDHVFTTENKHVDCSICGELIVGNSNLKYRVLMHLLKQTDPDAPVLYDCGLDPD